MNQPGCLILCDNTWKLTDVSAQNELNLLFIQTFGFLNRIQNCVKQIASDHTEFINNQNINVFQCVNLHEVYRVFFYNSGIKMEETMYCSRMFIIRCGNCSSGYDCYVSICLITIFYKLFKQIRFSGTAHSVKKYIFPIFQYRKNIFLKFVIQFFINRILGIQLGKYRILGCFRPNQSSFY